MLAPAITPEIRSALSADAAGIARLLPDLGYAATPEDVQRRLARIAHWPDQEVLVAIVDGEIVGLCHLQGVPLIASDGYAEVQALVVSQAFQRRGIGAALLRQAVSWSRLRGYTRTRLRSGMHRHEAHLFYESQGFAKARPSYAFECSDIVGDA